MTGRQHFVFGISAATAVALSSVDGGALSIGSPLLFVALSAVGSVAPDVDSKTSKIGRMLSPLPVLLNLLFDILEFGRKPIKYTPSGVAYTPHRRFMHDPLFAGLGLVILTAYYPFLLGFTFGYLGHLLLDSTTSGGIPVAYLFNKKPFHPLSYKNKFDSDSNAAILVTSVFASVAIAITWFADKGGLI